MARQFQQLGILGLEDLFAKSKGELQVLRNLEYELRHRQVPRARSLMVKVRAAIKVLSVKQADVVVTPLVEQLENGEIDLFGSEPARRQELNPAEPGESGESYRGKATEWESEQVPVISISDAYEALRATSGSSWESIELTRRRLVQLASPALATDEKRKGLQCDAERINAAYKVIAQDRIRSRG